MNDDPRKPRSSPLFRCAYVFLEDEERYSRPGVVGWRLVETRSCPAEIDNPDDRAYCERCNEYYCLEHADPARHHCSPLEGRYALNRPLGPSWWR